MNQNKHVAIWLIIIEYYSRTVTDETVMMFARQTDSTGISAEELQVAFDKWSLDPEKCSRFPLPGQLIAIHRGTGSSRSAADQLVADVLKAIERYHPQYGFTDPKGEETCFKSWMRNNFGLMSTVVLERFGGPSALWYELNSRNCVLTTLRAQLRDLAQSLVEAPNASRQEPRTVALPGSPVAELEKGMSRNVTDIVKKASEMSSM